MKKIPLLFSESPRHFAPRDDEEGWTILFASLLEGSGNYLISVTFRYNTLMTPATLHIPKRNITIELNSELENALLGAIENYNETLFDRSLQTPGVKSRFSRLSRALDTALGD